MHAAIITGMVTFCLGSARQKREYFKNKGVLVLDNIEVLFCASENGKNYFAYGAVPFSEFEVADYIKYRRALCGGETDLSVLTRLGISLRKKFGRLCEAERRAVQLAEKAGGKASASVLINLDGARYSRKNMRVLDRLLLECENAYVCVTDIRFSKRTGVAHERLYFGKPNIKAHKAHAEFYAAKLLKRRLGATRVSVM